MIFCREIFEFLNQVSYVRSMIIPERHRILIVPDFGTGADDGMMSALKDAIEVRGEAKVIVGDLRQMVLDEHSGEELQEARVIELAARKLESMATSRDLNWGSYADDGPGDPLHDLASAYEESAEETPQHEAADHNVLPRTIQRDLGNGRTLKIHVSRGSDDVTGAPHTIVVFGRSAMLADGVGNTDVLFINPVYDSEWPWKKQYYAGRKAAENYYADNLFPKERIETAYSFGTVGYGRFPQPSRYAVFTSEEDAGNGSDFKERYPRLSMINAALNNDVDALGDQIISFDSRKMDIPLLEIDRLLVDFPKTRFHQLGLTRFSNPVQMDGFTATGLDFGVPMANWQSGLRVRVKEKEYSIPIESFRHYQDISVLRDTVAAGREASREAAMNIRRIMIVPDYFTPHDNPAVLELRRSLEEKGYRVTVFCAGNTLEKSRQGLERICKRRGYDLILTIETGCLLAARLSSSHRIYINPDWEAWEWMDRMLGEESVRNERRGDHEGPMFSYRIDRDEIDMACDMAQRYNIKKGDRMSLGWFTSDQINSYLPADHMARFGSAAYPPLIGLDTEAGIEAIASQIDNFLKSYES